MQKEVIKASEFIDLIGITPKTFYTWIKHNDISTIKIGGLHFISREELERLNLLSSIDAKITKS